MGWRGILLAIATPRISRYDPEQLDKVPINAAREAHRRFHSGRHENSVQWALAHVVFKLAHTLLDILDAAEHFPSPVKVAAAE